MAITVEQLREWSQVTASDPATLAALDDAVAAANALIERRCVPFAGEWPAEVTVAALIEAARTFKRRGSPEGVSGLGGDFGVVRVSSWDPTIEANLSPYLKLAWA